MRLLLAYKNLVSLRNIFLPQHSTVRIQGLKKILFYINRIYLFGNVGYIPLLTDLPHEFFSLNFLLPVLPDLFLLYEI